MPGNAPHIEAFKENVAEIGRLTDIHKKVAGPGKGRKYNVEVLNKSAIVLLLACWESFVEDIAASVFDQILTNAKMPTVFPEHVLAIAAKEIKKGDTSVLWGISGDGWRAELTNHKTRILDKYIERNSFNTPSADNVDRLFSELIGLTSLSREWWWPNMTIDRSKAKLAELIELRGNIAHRVKTSSTVRKATVIDYRNFLHRLAVITHNRAIAFLYAKTKARPWHRYRYGKTA